MPNKHYDKKKASSGGRAVIQRLTAGRVLRHRKDIISF
jgi:hypothetical protein